MGIETAAVIGAIAAVAGTTASIENSAQQSRLGGQAKDRAKHDQNVARARAESEAEKADIQASNEAARQRQKGVKSDRANTILTGPSGVGAAGGATTLGTGAGSTVLGS